MIVYLFLYFGPAVLAWIEAVVRWTRWAAVAAFLVTILVLLDGCGHVGATGLLWPEPFPRVTVPDPTPIPEDTPLSSVQILDGIPVWCASLDEADYLREVDDLYPVCQGALDLSYRGRQGDREQAEAIVAACEGQLKAAK